MHTLDFVIENNKKEAIEILMNHKGRINFASGLDKGIHDNTFKNSDIDVNDDLPTVILDCGNGPFDNHVLAAEVVNDNIEILVLDPEENRTEWIEVSICCSYSENDVYLTIENFK